MENITVVNSSNSSLTVGWAVPLGYVELYTVNISSAELNTSLIQNSPVNSSVIGNLTAGRVFNLTVTTVSGVLKNISNTVLVATSELEKLHVSPSCHHDIKHNLNPCITSGGPSCICVWYFPLEPNPPEAVRASSQTDVSISLAWFKPLSMEGVSVSYEVSYRSNQSGVSQTLNQTSSLNVMLTNLLPGSQYDITVVTVGVKDLRSSYVNLSSYTGTVKHPAQHAFTLSCQQ